MPQTSRLPLLDYPNNIWSRVPIVKFLITQFSLLSVATEYSPLQPVIKILTRYRRSNGVTLTIFQLARHFVNMLVQLVN
jgi:hypothetical protein